ncbi:hypothetical protein CB1_000061028 [Camelus ferus]|nr:hypothetical protein CB1_000061028 [Camelus ferus]
MLLCAAVVPQLMPRFLEWTLILEVSKCFRVCNFSARDVAGIRLRPYQLEGVNWLAQRFHCQNGCILGDEMGLGKTCQTIALFLYLTGRLNDEGPFLILCPLSVLSNWKEEMERLAPGLSCVAYAGDKEERARLQQDLKQESRFHVLLTTYEICLKDASFLKSKRRGVVVGLLAVRYVSESHETEGLALPPQLCVEPARRGRSSPAEEPELPAASDALGGTLHSISFPRGCHILAPNLIRACFINCRASFLTCNGEEEHVQQKAPGLEWGG